LQFAEDFDEADDENHRRSNIHPEYNRRHAEWRESQSRYDDNELLEWQRGTLPSAVDSSGDILELQTEGGNHAGTVKVENWDEACDLSAPRTCSREGSRKNRETRLCRRTLSGV